MEKSNISNICHPYTTSHLNSICRSNCLNENPIPNGSPSDALVYTYVTGRSNKKRKQSHHEAPIENYDEAPANQESREFNFQLRGIAPKPRPIPAEHCSIDVTNLVDIFTVGRSYKVRKKLKISALKSELFWR